MTPGIVELYCFDALSLPDWTLPESVFNPVMEIEGLTEIALNDVASLVEESSPGDFCAEVKTTLSFSSPDELHPGQVYAFLAVDAVGNSWIVGNCPPVCGVLKRSDRIDSPGGSPTTNEYVFEIPVKKHSLYES